jgi:hypothetical protein
MVKEVSSKCLSHEDGYKKATSYSSLDMLMYEVVNELRETIRKLQERITAQDTIINELKNGGGGGGGGGSGGGALSFADIVSGKATVASAAVVALLARETKQQNERGSNVTFSGLAEPKAGESYEEAVKAVLAPIGI